MNTPVKDSYFPVASRCSPEQPLAFGLPLRQARYVVSIIDCYDLSIRSYSHTPTPSSHPLLDQLGIFQSYDPYYFLKWKRKSVIKDHYSTPPEWDSVKRVRHTNGVLEEVSESPSPTPPVGLPVARVIPERFSEEERGMYRLVTQPHDPHRPINLGPEPFVVHHDNDRFHYMVKAGYWLSFDGNGCISVRKNYLDERNPDTRPTMFIYVYELNTHGLRDTTYLSTPSFSEELITGYSNASALGMHFSRNVIVINKNGLVKLDSFYDVDVDGIPGLTLSDDSTNDIFDFITAINAHEHVVFFDLETRAAVILTQQHTIPNTFDYKTVHYLIGMQHCIPRLTFTSDSGATERLAFGCILEHSGSYSSHTVDLIPHDFTPEFVRGIACLMFGRHASAHFHIHQARTRVIKNLVARIYGMQFDMTKLLPFVENLADPETRHLTDSEVYAIDPIIGSGYVIHRNHCSSIDGLVTYVFLQEPIPFDSLDYEYSGHLSTLHASLYAPGYTPSTDCHGEFNNCFFDSIIGHELSTSLRYQFGSVMTTRNFGQVQFDVETSHYDGYGIHSGNYNGYDQAERLSRHQHGGFTYPVNHIHIQWFCNYFNVSVVVHWMDQSGGAYLFKPEDGTPPVATYNVSLELGHFNRLTNSDPPTPQMVSLARRFADVPNLPSMPWAYAIVGCFEGGANQNAPDLSVYDQFSDVMNKFIDSFSLLKPMNTFPVLFDLFLKEGLTHGDRALKIAQLFELHGLYWINTSHRDLVVSSIMSYIKFLQSDDSLSQEFVQESQGAASTSAASNPQACDISFSAIQSEYSDVASIMEAYTTPEATWHKYIVPVISIAVFAAGLCGLSLPTLMSQNHHGTKNWFKSFSDNARGLTNVASGYKTVTGLVNSFMVDVVGVDMDDESRLVRERVSTDLVVLEQYVNKINKDYSISPSSVFWNWSEVVKTEKRIAELSRVLYTVLAKGKVKIDVAIVKAFQATANEFLGNMKVYQASISMRRPPIVIYFEGSAGTGKSLSIPILLNAISKKLNVSLPVWSRPRRNDFDDGNNDQPVIVCDDFGQFADSRQKDAAFLLDVAGSTPFQGNQAKLERKESFITPLYVICTSNLSLASEDFKMANSSALLRRVDFYVKTYKIDQNAAYNNHSNVGFKIYSKRASCKIDLTNSSTPLLEDTHQLIQGGTIDTLASLCCTKHRAMNTEFKKQVDAVLNEQSKIASSTKKYIRLEGAVTRSVDADRRHYILIGPPGCGKTYLTREFLPDRVIQEFCDGDLNETILQARRDYDNGKVCVFTVNESTMDEKFADYRDASPANAERLVSFIRRCIYVKFTWKYKNFLSITSYSSADVEAIKHTNLNYDDMVRITLHFPESTLADKPVPRADLKAQILAALHPPDYRLILRELPNVYPEDVHAHLRLPANSTEVFVMSAVQLGMLGFRPGFLCKNVLYSDHIEDIGHLARIRLSSANSIENTLIIFNDLNIVRSEATKPMLIECIDRSFVFFTQPKDGKHIIRLYPASRETSIVKDDDTYIWRSTRIPLTQDELDYFIKDCDFLNFPAAGEVAAPATIQTPIWKKIMDSLYMVGMFAICGVSMWRYFETLHRDNENHRKYGAPIAALETSWADLCPEPVSDSCADWAVVALSNYKKMNINRQTSDDSTLKYGKNPQDHCCAIMESVKAPFAKVFVVSDNFRTKYSLIDHSRPEIEKLLITESFTVLKNSGYPISPHLNQEFQRVKNSLESVNTTGKNTVNVTPVAGNITVESVDPSTIVKQAPASANILVEQKPVDAFVKTFLCQSGEKITVNFPSEVPEVIGFECEQDNTVLHESAFNASVREQLLSVRNNIGIVTAGENRCKCLFVESEYAVTVAHIFADIEDPVEILHYAPGTSPTDSIMAPYKAKLITIDYELDIALVHCRVSQQPRKIFDKLYDSRDHILDVSKMRQSMTLILHRLPETKAERTFILSPAIPDAIMKYTARNIDTNTLSYPTGLRSHQRVVGINLLTRATVAGDCGNPVFVKYDDKWCLAGIHSGGSENLAASTASILTTGVYSRLKSKSCVYEQQSEKSPRFTAHFPDVDKDQYTSEYRKLSARSLRDVDVNRPYDYTTYDCPKNFWKSALHNIALFETPYYAGGMKCVGYYVNPETNSKIYVRSNTGTVFRRSPLAFEEDFDKYHPTYKTRFDPHNLKQIDPGIAAFEKWKLSPTNDLDVPFLHSCAEEIGNYVAQILINNNVGIHPCTVEQALNVLPEFLHSTSINGNSCVGHPWNIATNAVKKSDCLNIAYSGDNGNAYYTLADNSLGKQIRSNIFETLDHMSKLEVPFFVGQACLKDEVTKAGKDTRMFIAMDIVHFIIGRMLLGPLWCGMADCNDQLPIGYCIDPTSLDWHAMVTKVLNKGNNFVAIDYKSWDKTLPRQTINATTTFYKTVFRACLPDISEKLLNCIVAYHSTIDCPFVEFKGSLFRSPGGMPSGYAGTLQENCIIHWTKDYYIFKKLMMKAGKFEFATLECFMSKIGQNYCGDDKFVCVPDSLIDIYNGITISTMDYEHFGMTATNGDKTGPPDKSLPLHKVDYLSRSIVNCDGKFLGPLKETRLRKMLTYVRAKRSFPWVKAQTMSDYDPKIIREVTEAFEREISLHPPATYRFYHNHLLECFRNLGIPYPISSGQSTLRSTVLGMGCVVRENASRRTERKMNWRFVDEHHREGSPPGIRYFSMGLASLKPELVNKLQSALFKETACETLGFLPSNIKDKNFEKYLSTCIATEFIQQSQKKIMSTTLDYAKKSNPDVASGSQDHTQGPIDDSVGTTLNMGQPGATAATDAADAPRANVLMASSNVPGVNVLPDFIIGQFFFLRQLVIASTSNRGTVIFTQSQVLLGANKDLDYYLSRGFYVGGGCRISIMGSLTAMGTGQAVMVVSPSGVTVTPDNFTLFDHSVFFLNGSVNQTLCIPDVSKYAFRSGTDKSEIAMQLTLMVLQPYDIPNATGDKKAVLMSYISLGPDFYCKQYVPVPVTLQDLPQALGDSPAADNHVMGLADLRCTAITILGDNSGNFPRKTFTDDIRLSNEPFDTTAHIFDAYPAPHSATPNYCPQDFTGWMFVSRHHEVGIPGETVEGTAHFAILFKPFDWAGYADAGDSYRTSLVRGGRAPIGWRWFGSSVIPLDGKFELMSTFNSQYPGAEIPLPDISTAENRAVTSLIDESLVIFPCTNTDKTNGACITNELYNHVFDKNLLWNGTDYMLELRESIGDSYSVYGYFRLRRDGSLWTNRTQMNVFITPNKLLHWHVAGPIPPGEPLPSSDRLKELYDAASKNYLVEQGKKIADLESLVQKLGIGLIEPSKAEKSTPAEIEDAQNAPRTNLTM